MSNLLEPVAAAAGGLWLWSQGWPEDARMSTDAPPGDASIDAFIDALWLEDGLSHNTLAAYRRDLTLYAVWLQGQGRTLIDTTEFDLSG